MTDETSIRLHDSAMSAEGNMLEPTRETKRRKRPRVPDERRKRVRVACESCRKNKLRCNGMSPCERCESNGKECCYDPKSVAGADHPGFRSSPACSVIESQDHNNSQTRPQQHRHTQSGASESDSRQEVHLPKAPATLSPRRRLVDSAETRIDHTNVIRETPSIHHAEDNIILGSKPTAAASVTVVNQWKTHFEGASSYWSFIRSVKQAVTDDVADVEDSGEADCGWNSVHHAPMPSFGSEWRTGVLGALPPRDVVTFLSTSFFRYAQANYFCIHSEIFSRKLNAFYEGTQEFATYDALSSRRSIEFISTLFMVLAIGSQFAEIGDTSRGGTKEPFDKLAPFDPSQVKVPTPSQNPGWRFYMVSKRLLSDVVCSSSMTSVQVCFLQGIYLPSTTSRDAGYNLLGLALRMAINMGLHRSFRSSSLHTHVRELRNRLWWSVYVAERLFSIDMGRPISISDGEIDAELPTHDSEWNSGIIREMNIDGLLAIIRLCRLLGPVIDQVYCKATSDKGTIIRPTVLRQLKYDLQQCKASLPVQMLFENHPTRSTAHLSLTYEQANILLTRSCLNSIIMMRHSNRPLGKDATKFLKQQVQDCVNAAVAAVRVLRGLQSRSLLCRYSFHDTVYCSSALHALLLVDQKLNDLVEVPKSVMHEGILVLAELATGSEAAASGLRYILRALTVSTDKATGTESTCISLETDVQRGRNAWKNWTMAQNNNDISKESAVRSMDLEVHNSELFTRETKAKTPFDNSDIFETSFMALADAVWLDEGAPGYGMPPGDSESEGQLSSEISGTSFLIPNDPEFDVLSRDLVKTPLWSF